MHFPRFDADKIDIIPIEKGGSDRKFYRVRCSPDQSIILVKYNLEREENRHYVQIAQFLGEHEIRAPKIYFHDPAEGLIWIEGNLPAEFNAALYLWEQNYFFENCLGRYFEIGNVRLATLATLPALSEIAERLDRLPRNLVHRDFQSQNLIIRNGQAYLIDFQGMRPGLAAYDLASLLYDPYVDLTNTERAELIAYYRDQQIRNGTTVNGEFDFTLRLCAMQRLMQALGAYGFLGLVKGHNHFLQHIPRALSSLRSIVAAIDGLAPLEQQLASII
jgi:aminoglycoside/choline kinase family phosphotransferase